MEIYDVYEKEIKKFCRQVVFLFIIGILVISCILLLLFTDVNEAIVSFVGGSIFVGGFFYFLTIFRKTLEKCKEASLNVRKKMECDENKLHQFENSVHEYECKIQEYEKLTSNVLINSTAPEIVKSLMEWGFGISQIVRTGQTYDFVMEDSSFKADENKPAVKITGTHIYTIDNKSDGDTLQIPVSIKDELGLQSREKGWGFSSLHYQITGERKQKYALDAGEETNVVTQIPVPPKKSVTFEFVSVGVYLPSDRYVWYSQDFCNGCSISISNKTTFSIIERYQINHREEPQLRAKIDRYSDPEKINIDIPIYPREGFTMYWKEKET